MRKRISLLVAALMLALTMSFGSVAAFADTQACQEAQKNPNWDCKGNKLINPGGKNKGKVSNLLTLGATRKGSPRRVGGLSLGKGPGL